MAPRGALAVLRSFPRAFWLINGVELLERAAYYGTVAVFSFYLAYTLGFSSAQVGLLFAALLPLLYFLPALTAALAEKYGFRVSLLAAFALMALGYAAVGLGREFWGILASVVVIGVGAGTFKPLAAAVVAESTREEQRNFGFAIYYWLINVGGFASPLLIGIFVPEALFALAFAIAAALSVVNLALIALLYRDLRPPQPEARVTQAVRRLGPVFRDRAFVVLLVIYSGFWFMYSMNWTFLPLYMEDFAVMPDWFNVALLATLNPGTIITLGPVLGKVTERVPSVPLMVVGIATFTLGFAMVGFAPNPATFVMGMVLAGAGEFLTQPAFLSYVSRVAPSRLQTVYLGAAFVPLGIGFVLGPAVGGFLYTALAETLQRPKVFWAVIVGIGLLTLAALLLYHLRTGAAKAPRKARARARLAAPAVAVAALLLVPVVLGAASLAGTDVSRRVGGGAGPGALRDAAVLFAGAEEAQGRDTMEVAFALPAGAQGLSLTLAWEDEAPPGTLPGTQNQPDRFGLAVRGPGGLERAADGTNPQGQPGRVEVALPGALPAGNYTARVELLEAGPATLGPATLAQDPGNAWTLRGAYRAA